MTVRMVALKSTRYRGRLYRAGEEFDAPVRVAELYRKLRRAVEADAVLAETPMPESPGPGASRALEAAQEGLAIEALRAEFEAFTGSAPDRRWGEARLRGAIREAKAAPSVQELPPADHASSNMGDLLC